MTKLLRRAVGAVKPTAIQVAGAAAAVAGVCVLAGLGWALVVGGLGALAFGVAEEVG